MPRTLTHLRILVSSPSDLDEERRLLEDIIGELNLMWTQQLGISLELIKWETHTFPGVATDPQAVIDQQLPNDYDIFLAMFWTRIGTPTPRFSSGTLEEFEIAYKRWEQDRNSIRLMIYFKTQALSPDEIDPDQLKQVLEFRKSLNSRGILYSTFIGNEDFSQLLRLHLSAQVQDFLRSSLVRLEQSTTSTVSSTPTVTDLTEGPVELAVEEGFLDLIEITEAESQRATEVIQRLGVALEHLNARTVEITGDLNSLDGDNNAKVAAYKRLSNRQADNMMDFVTQMRSDMPILDDSLSNALDAYGRMITLLPDFGTSPENYSQLQRVIGAANNLKEGMVFSKKGLGDLRMVIAGLPRITIQFNRSKRDILSILDTILAIYDRGLNLLREIEDTGNSILGSWKTNVLPPTEQPS